MKAYIEKIYKTRYFWSHLAKNDLKSRFRRSKLGLMWTVIQPLCMTLILSFVFSAVFRQPLGEYAMYILSGIVVWNMLQACLVNSGSALFASEQYIRQFNHPISIYTLRYAILNVATFLMEMIALVIWVLFTEPMNLVFGILTLPISLVFYFPLVWGLVTIAGYSGAKYRDYPQIMGLLMQMVYYLSPVFFKQEMFLSNSYLELLFELNPITHILNLIRCPFVYGEMPAMADFLFVLVTDVVVVLWAVYVNKNNEKKVIFYL